MKKLIISALFVATVLCAWTSTSQAARIPFIFNSGQKIFRAGPLPEPYDKEEQLKGFESGYACDIKGVMWSYYSVSNCKPVAFQGDSYMDEEHLVSAIQAKYPESSMERGVWGHYGWMMMVALVVGGALLILKEVVTGKKEEDGEKAA